MFYLLSTLMDTFPPCSISRGHLKKLERKGFLPHELAFDWHLEEESIVMVPRKGEVVVLASFHKHGFGLPLHPFV
jgi:hypothetical protein